MSRHRILMRRRLQDGLLALCLQLALACAPAAAEDAKELPSWRAGATREAVLNFVARVSDPASLDYVPAADRVAVFDHDGTLCPEQPIYLQLAFALDRVRSMVEANPEWRTRQPFKAVIDGDREAVLSSGRAGLGALMSEAHTGMTVEQFESKATDWLAVANHPRFQRPYTELAYQPVRELMDLLRSRGFRVYIVSSGSIEFLRVLSESMYGVPREQVIGPTAELDYVLTEDGRSELVRRNGIRYERPLGAKAVAAYRALGRRPIFAMGNSDDDLALLQWVSAAARPHLALLLHHTDAQREWAYDRDSPVGMLDRALTEAGLRGWPVVDMARDWTRVFAFEVPAPAAAVQE